MSWRPKVKKNSPNVEISFSNWLAQLANMVMPKTLLLVAGRASSKTTEFIVERLIEMVYEMPGAPICWVADTYSNLQQNVLPMVTEGLERKGFKADLHYVIGKKPPEYTTAEKEDLPAELKEHFWKPYNQLVSYKHTMVFFSGLNITFGSMDRPASLAGRSYVHVIGDEVKYFAPHKIANLLKAVRGYFVKYGNSVFYRGQTFTTDMPNTANIGEYDWIVQQGNRLNKDAIMLVVKVALIVNEALQEYIVAAEKPNNTEETIKKQRTYQRWLERWELVRRQKDAETLFYISSSYVNSDHLTADWFSDAFKTDLGDANTAILSMRPSLESGERFYANIGERHFYMDGSLTKWQDSFGIREKEDCRILKHLNLDKGLDLGMDFGNMMSMTIAQQGRKYYRCLKFIYTLSPDFIRELADEFIRYFKPHREKTVHVYYDRAGNNFAEAGQDYASQLKDAIEKDKEGKRTGWTVILMSKNQGNIGQNEEYIFMQELLSGHNHKLPKVLIDFYNCKPLKASLENARTEKNRKGQIVKNKKSEKLPIHRLPMESTNPSDSFKYLMMRREWRKLIRTNTNYYVGDVTIRTIK